MNKLSPFKWFVLQNFPFIEADFDALTNYELMCKVVEYLNETIAKTNELGNQVEILTNWFDNLDVQDEVDHKLDEMAESGELEEIITAYLQVSGVLCYNTVSDMKQATNLINGSFAEVLGYHTINDGGRGIYKVRPITNEDVVDEATIIALDDDTLIAELIHENEINVMNFGCYGDGTHDDTQNFQKAIDYATSFANTVSTTGINEKEQITIISPQNKIYKISYTLTFTQTHIGLDMHNSVIYGTGAITMLSFGTAEHAVYYTNFKNIYLKADEDVNIGIYIHGSWNTYENIWIGGEITSTKKFQEYAIYSYNSWDNYFYNVQMYDIEGDGLYAFAANSTTFVRCTAHRVKGHCFIISNSLSVSFTDCDIGWSVAQSDKYGFYIDLSSAIDFQNCYFEQFRNGICLTNGTRGVNIINSYFNLAHNQQAVNMDKKAITLENCAEVTISAYIENNGVMEETGENDFGIYYDNTQYTCNDVKIENSSVFHNSFIGTKYSESLKNISKFDDFSGGSNKYYSLNVYNKDIKTSIIRKLDTNNYIAIPDALKKGRILEKTIAINSISSSNSQTIKVKILPSVFAVKMFIALNGDTNKSNTTIQEIIYTGSIVNNALQSAKRTASENYGSTSAVISSGGVSYDSTNTELNIVINHEATSAFSGFAKIEVLSDTPTNIE